MPDSIPGEYHLRNIREMASGFPLRPDLKFQFFFSYGTLDRSGTGNWEQRGDRIVFNSIPKPQNDYRLVSSRKTGDDFINIIIDEPNQVLRTYTYISLENGATDTWRPLNSHGDLQFPPQELQTISLLFEFCPERFSSFPVTGSDHNEFVFKAEPWIVGVFLKEFSLDIVPDGLQGKHPLMQGDSFSYGKTPES